MLVEPSPSLPTKESACVVDHWHHSSPASSYTVLSFGRQAHATANRDSTEYTSAGVVHACMRVCVCATAGTADTAGQLQFVAGPVARNYCIASATLALRGVDGVASKSVICC